MAPKQHNPRQVLNHPQEVRILKPPPVSFRVAKRLQSLINTLKIDITPENVRYLKSCYSRPNCPVINYDDFAASFSHLYFFENFWKSISVFSHEPPHLANHIIDVGCGSGTTTLGYLTALSSSLQETKWKIDVLLIDRSQTQLALANKALKLASEEFQNLQIMPHLKCLDLQRWKPREQSADAILFGHVLNENRPTARLLLEKAFHAVRSCGRIYVIERLDDRIWKAICHYAAELQLPFESRITKLRRKRQVLLSESEIDKKYVTTRYLILRIPERKKLAYLLQLYFHAWKTQSVDELERIFEPDAEYYEKPYQRPFRGIEQIKEYWKENVLTQRNIHLRILRVAYNNEDAFAEWEASFERGGYRVRLRGGLILHVSREKERVNNLDEYYESRKYKVTHS